MLLEFRPPIGATIFDLCLNTYLSLNLLPKFVKDNGIENLNYVTGQGEVYIYDTDFIWDEFMSKDIKNNNYKFTTGDITIPNASLSSDDFLLIESGAILQSEAGQNFLI